MFGKEKKISSPHDPCSCVVRELLGLKIQAWFLSYLHPPINCWQLLSVVKMKKYVQGLGC